MLSVPIPPPPHVPLSLKHYYSAISPLSLAHITIQRALYAGTSTVLISSSTADITATNTNTNI